MDLTRSSNRSPLQHTIVLRQRSTRLPKRKTEIDNMVHQALYQICKVMTKNLSKKDIEKIELNFKKPKNKKKQNNAPAQNTKKIETKVDILPRRRESLRLKLKSNMKTSLKPNSEEERILKKTKNKIFKTNAPASKGKNTTEVDNLEIELSRTHNVNVPIEVDLVNEVTLTATATTSSTNLLVENVGFGDNRSMMDESNISSNVIHLMNSKQIHETEQLYLKYFNKSIQDTILTIANILNIIPISDNHHKVRMDESLSKKTEAERYDKHKKILEAKLKKYFSFVVTTFEGLEFVTALQILFMSILSVLYFLDQPKLNKCSRFNKIAILLINSLKNSKYDDNRVYVLLCSEKFRHECIDLSSSIENYRHCDPGITDRMPLFFVSTDKSREHFQSVIDFITRDSNEDLGILIENASMKCSLNSITIRSAPDITPVTAGTIQQCVLRNNHARSIELTNHLCSGLFFIKFNGLSLNSNLLIHNSDLLCNNEIHSTITKPQMLRKKWQLHL